jgi:hypothetical protein
MIYENLLTCHIPDVKPFYWDQFCVDIIWITQHKSAIPSTMTSSSMEESHLWVSQKSLFACTLHSLLLSISVRITALFYSLSSLTFILYYNPLLLYFLVADQSILTNYLLIKTYVHTYHSHSIPEGLPSCECLRGISEIYSLKTSKVCHNDLPMRNTAVVTGAKLIAV